MIELLLRRTLDAVAAARRRLDTRNFGMRVARLRAATAGRLKGDSAELIRQDRDSR